MFLVPHNAGLNDGKVIRGTGGRPCEPNSMIVTVSHTLMEAVQIELKMLCCYTLFMLLFCNVLVLISLPLLFCLAAIVTVLCHQRNHFYRLYSLQQQCFGNSLHFATRT
uniref:Uncharacterized protein n=1 Tax=Opuntia streptacantha TaxID=393608 RepID=A0A7C9CPP1_OPUST